ncbi:MAG: RNA ligase family protein [Zavarzinella sp.]
MSNSQPKLLTRTQFRDGVFDRDGHQCVICGAKAEGDVRLDAHHIMERRLWTAPDQFGGYFLDNGVTLCDRGYDKTESGNFSCHLQAGMTVISPDDCRKAAGIQRLILPDHLYFNQIYTVWGDPVLSNGRRMRGELYWDESVQTMLTLGGVLNLYTDYVKHPRTCHLPFSPKVEKDDLGDDRVMEHLERFQGNRVIATVKMDGGQNTLYRDYLHARTTDFKSDETMHWLQNFHSKFCYDIPQGYRVNVENLYVKHDIYYQNLPSYAMAWMMWDDKNNCLSWDETCEWFALFDDILKQAGTPGLSTVPVLYDGMWDDDLIRNLYRDKFADDEMEGFVVRLADQFHYREFKYCVGKYVRENHTPQHGGNSRDLFVRNKLKGN